MGGPTTSNDIVTCTCMFLLWGVFAHAEQTRQINDL